MMWTPLPGSEHNEYNTRMLKRLENNCLFMLIFTSAIIASGFILLILSLIYRC